ncbi:MAG: Mur ligase family protein [Devosia sp.]
MRVPRWFGPLAGPLENSIFRLNLSRHGRAAGRAQARFVGTYVAVTGSVGKSTTTGLIGHLLADSGSVELAAFRNALPQVYAVLRHLDQRADYVVQEFSAHPPGMFEHAAKHISIDVAVVTTVGLDHLRRFRTAEAVAAEKAKLVQAVRAGGLVCLNADYPLVKAMAEDSPARVVLFGRATDAEVRAEAISMTLPGRLEFDLVMGNTRRRVKTRFLGTAMLDNCLAALSVVHGLGLDMDKAVARLETIEPILDRLNVVAGPDGNSYALDTAKASHWSTMQLAQDIAGWGGRKVFVLGNVSDTGNHAERKYAQILRLAAKSADLAIGVGDAASPAERLSIGDTAQREKTAVPNVKPARTFEEARVLIASMTPSLVILKGGRDYDLKQSLPSGTVLPKMPPERERLDYRTSPSPALKSAAAIGTEAP